MKLKFFGLMVISLAICAVPVAAHPLGNFSVNQYSRLEVENSRIKIRQVLDMAEIPTFQTKSEIDTDKDGALSDAELKAYADKITPEYVGNLTLSVNNQPLEIRADSKTVELKPGAGNLPTLEIKWNLTADLPAADAINQVNFENKNYAERLGWNEIVVNRFGNINVFDSTAYGSGVTEELKAYPEETLNAPLSERTAAFSFTTGAVPENAGLLQNRDGHISVAVQKIDLPKLINVPEITPTIALSAPSGIRLGAMHAMSTGHGKTVVGAYLSAHVDIKTRDFLRLTVTSTHTLGVFALGLITIFASNFILPEKLMPFLSFVSGLLVFFIGISLFKDRLFSALGWKAASHHQHHEHGHTHEYDHEHGHTHSHEDGHTHKHHAHENHSHDNLTHTHGGSTHTHLPPKR